MVFLVILGVDVVVVGVVVVVVGGVVVVVIAEVVVVITVELRKELVSSASEIATVSLIADNVASSMAAFSLATKMKLNKILTIKSQVV